MSLLRSYVLIFGFITSFTFVSTASADDWEFGVTLGLHALNVEVDSGFDTFSGPVVSEIDLDFDDVDNAAEDAFGLSGFAKKGQGKINFAFGVLKLVGDIHSDVPLTGSNLDAKLSFKTTFADINYEHLFEDSHFSVYAGLRYTEQDIAFNLDTALLSIDREITEEWVDVYVGLGYVLPLTENVEWSNRIDVGGGGSDGSYTAISSLNWQFRDHLMASFFGKWYSIDYENGSEGDSDWYLYDGDEFGLGAAVTYIW